MQVAGLGEAVAGAALAAQGVAGIYDRKYHGNDLAWNELNHFMQIRQLQGQLVDTVRGQMYDFYEKKQRSFETSLLVSTLMLTIGFGFATNGTFPTDDKSQCVVRYFYALFAALGLVLPFLSMAAFLECRRRLSLWLGYFNEYIFREVDYEHKTTMAYLPNQKKMRQRAREMTEGLPQKEMAPFAHRLMKDIFNNMKGRKVAPRTNQQQHASEERVLEVRAGAARGSKESLEAYTEKYITRIQVAARHFLGLGVASNVLCAALLLGMYFRSAYPDTPHVWMMYSGIVGAGLVLWSVLQFLWLSEDVARPDGLQPNEYDDIDTTLEEAESGRCLPSHTSSGISESGLGSPLLDKPHQP